jgi:peptidoglycan lytic transglycosylase G
MAERPDYVKHGSSGGSSRLAALAGVLVAAGAVAALAWGVTQAVREEAAPPPPPPPPATVPQKPTLRIVFPEGFTRADMAKRIAEVNEIAKKKRKITPELRPKAYLRWSASAKPPPGFEGANPPHLEGFLFPATYEFTADTTSRALVRKQLEAFERAWSEVDLRDAKKKNLEPYDVLIIASMVERETIAPDERPKVAAVIYNRLKAGMPLGIDATIRYGLNVPGTEALRVSQLESDNPYNTRNRQGLPPTPIANPGLASMRAAAKPAKEGYLFFVRKPDKIHHFFTASESEFLAKACEYGYGCG